MKDMPSLRQLECLVTLAASRSFRRAAEQLGVTQPSLSGQIRALEQTLGITLFERRATGAELTPVGREALAYAEQVLQATRAMAAFASGARQRLSGRIRLGVSTTVGPYLLPKVVGRLHRSHPDLRLVVRESAPASLAHELLEGLHDAIIVQLPLRVDGCTLEELYRERLLVLLAADHPLAAEPVVMTEALAGRDVLSLDDRFQLGHQTAELCHTFGARLSADYQGGSLDALRLMVGMGAGIAFAPELYVRSVVQPGGDVVARPLRGRALHRLVGIAWRRSSSEAETMAELAEAARGAFAELTSTPLAP